MTGDLNGYYLVIHCQKREKRSRLARLRRFLISVILKTLYNGRKKFSKVIFNGRPICAHPDDVPTEFQKLTPKQLSKLKNLLDVVHKNGASSREDEFWRPGDVAPSSTPVSDDRDIDFVRVTEEVLDTVGNHEKHEEYQSVKQTDDDLHKYGTEATKLFNDTEDFHGPQRMPRAKAGNGQRGDMILTSFSMTDEKTDVSIAVDKKSEAEAATNETGHAEPDMLDIPLEVLNEKPHNSSQSMHPSLDTIANSSHPAVPGWRDTKIGGNVLTDYTREETDTRLTRCATFERRSDRPKAARGERTVKLRTEKAYVRQHKTNDRPKAARGEKTVIVRTEEEYIRQHNKPDRPNAARGARTIIKRTEKEYIRQHKGPKKAPDEDEEGSETSEDTDDGDIFNVPYLPKSQRKYATALVLPWMKK